jgi:hypothetical protein
VPEWFQKAKDERNGIPVEHGELSEEMLLVREELFKSLGITNGQKEEQEV